MNQLKTILVGVDFSECSRRALEQAVRLARWNNAQLNIIHVQDSSELQLAGVEFPPPLDELRARHRQRASAQLAEWAEQAGVPAASSREVINGAPLDVLLQESRSRQADLLVLGATGESLPPHGTGTLATKCLRKASTKVMLVQASQVRPDRRVLACVDFSEASRVAVAQALHVADQDQAEVHLLHVFRAEWQIWNFHQPLPALSEFEQNYRAIMEINLRQFVAVPPRINASYSVTSAETHGAGIADYARRVGADLVVLGSKGRTNLKYVLLGSTVERLLKEIACSVLVTRLPPADAGNTTAVSAGRKRPDPASAFKSMTNRPASKSKLRQNFAAGFWRLIRRFAFLPALPWSPEEFLPAAGFNSLRATCNCWRAALAASVWPATATVLSTNGASLRSNNSPLWLSFHPALRTYHFAPSWTKIQSRGWPVWPRNC